MIIPAALALALALAVIVLPTALSDELPVLEPLQVAPEATVPKPPIRGVTDNADRSAGAMATILARPLFSRTRRPSIAPSQTQRATADEKLPRLSGLVVWPAGSVAIFAPEGKSKSVAVGLGNAVGGWTVAAIGSASVTLERGDSRLTLHPMADASFPPPPPPVPPAIAELTSRPNNAPGQIAESGPLRTRRVDAFLQP